MLRDRLLFGPILIVLVLFGVAADQWIDARALPDWLAGWAGHQTWPPGVIVFVVVAGLAILASSELSRILRDKQIEARTWVTATAALLGIGLVGFVPSQMTGLEGAALVGASIGLLLAGSLGYYSRHKQVDGMIAAAGGVLLAFVYLGLMLGFLIAIRRESEAWVLLWVVLTTKSCDIGAYFTGKSIGRTKLAVWLSPGKTWEGTIGGIVFASVIGALGAWGLSSWREAIEMSWWFGAIAGAVFAVAGQLGDLLVSLLKRDAGVKDAGHSLPGFGGVLDVIDSLVLVAPIAFWLIRLAG